MFWGQLGFYHSPIDALRELITPPEPLSLKRPIGFLQLENDAPKGSTKAAKAWQRKKT